MRGFLINTLNGSFITSHYIDEKNEDYSLHQSGWDLWCIGLRAFPGRIDLTKALCHEIANISIGFSEKPTSSGYTKNTIYNMLSGLRKELPEWSLKPEIKAWPWDKFSFSLSKPDIFSEDNYRNCCAIIRRENKVYVCENGEEAKIAIKKLSKEGEDADENFNLFWKFFDELKLKYADNTEMEHACLNWGIFSHQLANIGCCSSQCTNN